MFPHVMMEVGFSQHYDKQDSVLAGVREWLVATKGGVKLGVLLKIEEGQVPGKTIKQLEEEVDVGDVANGIDVDDEQDMSSDLEDYYRRMATMKVDADKWIGKFTVFMETWVYDPTTGEVLVKQPRQVASFFRSRIYFTYTVVILVPHDQQHFYDPNARPYARPVYIRPPTTLSSTQ